MGRSEAISIMMERYWLACDQHKPHLAHIRLLTIDRLKYPRLTAKEKGNE